MRKTDVTGDFHTLSICVYPHNLQTEAYAQHIHTYTERIERQRDKKRGRENRKLV